MVGYSGTPLLQKLGIGTDSSVVVVGAPRTFKLVKAKGKKPFDVALLSLYEALQGTGPFSRSRPG